MNDLELSFEEALVELEAIAGKLERGQPSLAESLESFERGVSLLRQCRRRLDETESRIRELVEIDETGAARLRPFQHEASVEKERRESNEPHSPGAEAPTPRKRKKPDDPGLF